MVSIVSRVSQSHCLSPPAHPLSPSEPFPPMNDSSFSWLLGSLLRFGCWRGCPFSLAWSVGSQVLLIGQPLGCFGYCRCVFAAGFEKNVSQSSVSICHSLSSPTTSTHLSLLTKIQHPQKHCCVPPPKANTFIPRAQLNDVLVRRRWMRQFVSGVGHLSRALMSILTFIRRMSL